MKAPLLSLEITRFEKTGGPLTKRVYLKPDGAIANDSSDCRMSRGVMHRQHLLDWRALACLIEETPRNTAYALGVMRPDLPDSVPLVTRRDPRSAQLGFATRTAETILYREGRPGPVLLDYDTKGMPPDIRARMQECGGFLGALETVCAGFAAAGYIHRRSTSAGVFNAATGERYGLSDGEHLYLLVQDGADAKRFLYTLHDRCWLAGLAWYIVGKSGSLLERSIVDRTVWAAERLVFEASPDLDPPLAQEKREATIHDGAPLDTKAACADLNGVEQVDLRQRKAAAARALGNEVDAAKKNFVKAQVEAAVARGMDRSKAQRVAERWGKGVLRPGVILEFDDPDLGAVSVADILADPERFDGETLSDPVEGVSYGRNCAIIQVRDGMPSIFSFAHGRARYALRHDFESVEAAILAAGKNDAARVYCRLVLAADLDAVERKRLIKLASKRSGAGVRDVEDMESAARQAERQEKSATGTGQKPVIQLVAGEISRIVDEIENAVLAANLGLYQRNGNAVRIETAIIPIPDAPSRRTLVIREQEAETLREDLCKAARFEKFEKRSGEWVACDPPTQRAKDWTARHERMSLPHLTGVISSPLILPAERRIISTPGYDKDTGLFFEPLGASFPAISTNPTREDALAALALLRTLLEEFPFADGQRGANESTMLSAIVSAIMRAALGNVPLHAFNAPQARTGKSLAATLVSIIAQGRLPALCTAGKNEEELEKRIDAMLLWSTPFFVIDNINYPLESASLCVLLTQEEKRIRPLGTSDFPEITSRPFVECTGNNLALVGDLTGRSIRCTIDAKCERPEFRPIKRRSLLLDIKKDRARYAAAALTIVQAFLCAGAPPQAEPLGFFEKWSLYVRDALIWLGCADACETMEAIRADDPRRNDLARLMKAWWGLFHSEPHTVREAINNAMLEYDGALAHPDLNDALMQVARARAGGGLDGLRLSGWLRRHKRVVTGGKYFDRDPLDNDWGAARWALLEGERAKGRKPR